MRFIHFPNGHLVDIKNYLLLNLTFFLFLGLGLCQCSSQDSEEATSPPNILLIVADDLGYADLGCYGGDIETPNIDALAANGLRFSRFYASPYCAPTRAMLLSGNDNHIAGMGIQSYASDSFGYEGKLSGRIATIPQVLKQVGYHTYMAGKWHLGSDSLSNPYFKGFDESWINAYWGGNHYNNIGLTRNSPKSIYTENGQKRKWPEGAYSTDFFTDKLIEYIGKNKDDEKPFFAYAAYTSPHWPLQVDEKYWKKYQGRYDQGYEKLKEERLESLKKAGMIPEDAILPPNHERVIPWDSLTDMEKKMEARKMELYAGMLDNLDVNIGRLIQYLKEIGKYENTLILFMSDNGAAAEDFYHHPRYGPFLQENYSNEYENMGQASSFISYGPQWAEAGSSPFRYFKGQLTDGGNAAPMIISGPGVNWKNEIFHGLTTLMDIAPTFYELAQASYPDSLNGKKIYPLRGNSMTKLLKKSAEQIHAQDYIFALEYATRTMLRKGDWKILNNTRPYNEENFKLYNISEDLAEMNDLKEQEPQKFEELLTEWKKFIEEIQAQFPPPPRN